MTNGEFFIDKKILYYYKYCELVHLVEGKSKQKYITEKLKIKEREKNQQRGRSGEAYPSHPPFGRGCWV